MMPENDETFQMSEDELNAWNKKHEKEVQKTRNMVLAVSPATVTMSITDEVLPVYKIPENTLIKLGDGTIMEYKELEELRHKYEESLSRIHNIIKHDLSGYPV